MPAAPLVSVSVDLDAIACYWRIHSLPGEVPEEARFAVLRRCLPRFAELFARHRVKATFFVVGSDLENDPEGRTLLAGLARQGHELANHSFNHPYDLVRRSATEIASEIDLAHHAIASVSGTAPVGFRSPGYEITAEVIGLLSERGYRYDSSVFPAVPYYLAKAAVMGAMRVAGKTSASILGSPRVLLAPTTPYHPDAGNAYAVAPTGSQGLIELPVTVAPWTRFPVIGTAIVLLPELLRRPLVKSALSQPFFNFELHGIDLADAENDGLPGALIAKQPDLRRPFFRKLAALEATLYQARDAGARFVTLAEAATQF